MSHTNFPQSSVEFASLFVDWERVLCFLDRPSLSTGSKENMEDGLEQS